MLALFPTGFEEVDTGELLSLVAYTDAAGERRLQQEFGATVTTAVQPGWEDGWRSFHRPVRIGPLWIGPPWEGPPADALAVSIDPGRAFGTGAHATTRLAVELLVELAPASLLDAGCGSGVLSLAALKLGWKPVYALDDDPAAVEAARVNARRNHLWLDVRRVDVLSELLPGARVTVANIAGRSLTLLAPRLASPLLIASGYLAHDRPVLPGFSQVEHRESEGWAADLYRREE